MQRQTTECQLCEDNVKGTVALIISGSQSLLYVDLMTTLTMHRIKNIEVIATGYLSYIQRGPAIVELSNIVKMHGFQYIRHHERH